MANLGRMDQPELFRVEETVAPSSWHVFPRASVDAQRRWMEDPGRLSALLRRSPAAFAREVAGYPRLRAAFLGEGGPFRVSARVTSDIERRHRMIRRGAVVAPAEVEAGLGIGPGQRNVMEARGDLDVVAYLTDNKGGRLHRLTLYSPASVRALSSRGIPRWVETDLPGPLAEALNLRAAAPVEPRGALHGLMLKQFPDDGAAILAASNPSRYQQAARLLAHWAILQGENRLALTAGEMVAIHDGFGAVADPETRGLLASASSLSDLFSAGGEAALARMAPRLEALADHNRLLYCCGVKPHTGHWQRAMPDADLALVVCRVHMGAAFRPRTGEGALEEAMAQAALRVDPAAAREGRFDDAFDPDMAALSPLALGDFSPRRGLGDMGRARAPRRSDEDIRAYLSRVPWGEYPARRFGGLIQSDGDASSLLAGYLDGIEHFTPVRAGREGAPATQSILKCMAFWIRNRLGEERARNSPLTIAKGCRRLRARIESAAHQILQGDPEIGYEDAVEMAAHAMPGDVQSGVNFRPAVELALIGAQLRGCNEALYGDRGMAGDGPDPDEEALADSEPDDEYVPLGERSVPEALRDEAPDPERDMPGRRAAGVVEMFSGADPSALMGLRKCLLGSGVGGPSGRAAMEHVRRKEGSRAVADWLALGEAAGSNPVPDSRLPSVREMLDSASIGRLAADVERHVGRK